MQQIWVFHGAKAQFASGVFSSRDRAETWIAQHRLTGVLTWYPVDVGVFEWAVASGNFEVKQPEHETAAWIEGFTSGAQDHFHFENGETT